MSQVILSVLAMMTPAQGPVEAPVCLRACRQRVQRREARKRRVAEMRRYRRHPMPWCTWGPESGAHRPEWSSARYRQPNVSGGSGGGKFQILVSTWNAVGGFGEPHHAAPVVQERLARRVLASQGLSAWTNC